MHLKRAHAKSGLISFFEWKRRARNTLPIAVFVFTAGVFSASGAHAGTVTLLPGSLPSDQGFTFTGSLTESQIFSLNGDGSLHQASELPGAGSGVDGTAAYLNTGAMVAGNSFTINATLRVTGADSEGYPNNWTNPEGFFIAFGGADSGSAQVGFTTSEVALLTDSHGSFGGGQVTVSNDCTQFHNYTISGLFAPGGTFQVYIDGTYVGSNVLDDNYAATYNTLGFGDFTNGAGAVADLASFSVTVTPEPATLGFLGLSLFPLLRRGRRERRGRKL